jgi:transposase-like protein
MKWKCQKCGEKYDTENKMKRCEFSHIDDLTNDIMDYLREKLGIDIESELDDEVYDVLAKIIKRWVE